MTISCTRNLFHETVKEFPCLVSDVRVLPAWRHGVSHILVQGEPCRSLHELLLKALAIGHSWGQVLLQPKPERIIMFQ